MKKLITFFLGLCFMQISAQSEFQKHFEMSQFGVLGSYDLPGGILFKGLDSNGLDEGFCMVKADGTIAWHQFFEVGARITSSVMAPVNEAEYCHIMPLFHEISLFKTANHAFVWEKIFPEHPDVIVQDFPLGVMNFKNLTDGRICVAAKSITVVNLPNGSIGVECPVFFLFDENGNLLWSKMHKVGNDNFEPIDFMENSAGNLLVVGTFWPGTEGNTEPRGFGTIQIDLDNGSIAGTGSANIYTSSDADFSVGFIDEVNKTFLVNGINLNGSSPNYSSSFLIKLNDDGTFGQTTRFDATDTLASINLWLVKSAGNETFLGGVYKTFFPVTGHSFDNTFSLKTDTPASNIFWAKRYGPEPFDVGGQVLTTFYDFIINDTENTLLFSGTNELSSGFLWKANQFTGSAGCESADVGITNSNYFFNSTSIGTSVIFDEYLVSGNSPVIVNDTPLTRPVPGLLDFCSTLNIGDFDFSDHKISIFPNPAQGMVTISGKELRNCRVSLYDVCGKKVADYLFENQNEIIINSSSLKPGLYFVNFADKNEEIIGNQKLIIR